MKRLSPEEIVENMFSDMSSYESNIKTLLIKRLSDNIDSEFTYWDAWFRGADGSDLVNADKGVVYINEPELAHGAVDSIYEGELFWEDKMDGIDSIIKFNTDVVKEQIVRYVKMKKLNTKNSSDWQIIYDTASELMERHYKKCLYEYVRTGLENKFEAMGLTNIIPKNIIEIVDYIVDDINSCNTYKVNNKTNMDWISLGFNEWMESKATN